MDLQEITRKLKEAQELQIKHQQIISDIIEDLAYQINALQITTVSTESLNSYTTALDYSSIASTSQQRKAFRYQHDKPKQSQAAKEQKPTQMKEIKNTPIQLMQLQLEKTGAKREINLFIGYFSKEEERNDLINHLNKQDNINLIDLSEPHYGGCSTKSNIYFYAKIGMDTAYQLKNETQYIYINNIKIKVDKDNRLWQ